MSPARATTATSTYDSPVGRLTLIASEAGLRSVLWDGGDPAPVRLAAPHRETDRAAAVLEEACRQLDDYFAGVCTSFDLPLDLQGTAFQQDAWRALAEIPFGETRTYAQQARRLGRPSAFRAVGAANGRNPLSIVLPCHRVVGSNGSLTGFAGGLETKRWLLEHERAVVQERRRASDRPAAGAMRYRLEARSR